MEEFGFNICIMKRIQWGGFGNSFEFEEVAFGRTKTSQIIMNSHLGQCHRQ
jgi:hypothetical protein